MTRGNSREKARGKNAKKAKETKTKTEMTSYELQRAKEENAEKMRLKQAAADERKKAAGDGTKSKK